MKRADGKVPDTQKTLDETPLEQEIEPDRPYYLQSGPLCRFATKLYSATPTAPAPVTEATCHTAQQSDG